jgi:chorismate lyase/3-hydroxybenzoate synthase
VLHARLPGLGGLLLLGGDICRGELLVEVDGVHQLAD